MCNLRSCLRYLLRYNLQGICRGSHRLNSRTPRPNASPGCSFQKQDKETFHVAGHLRPQLRVLNSDISQPAAHSTGAMYNPRRGTDETQGPSTQRRNQPTTPPARFSPVHSTQTWQPARPLPPSTKIRSSTNERARRRNVHICRALISPMHQLRCCCTCACAAYVLGVSLFFLFLRRALSI